MKTNEVYTATLMDLRDVDSTMLTIYLSNIFHHLKKNPNDNLSSLLKQAEKDILSWTYGSLPQFYENLSGASKGLHQDLLKRYPYQIMLVVKSMELGKIGETRYSEWHSFMVSIIRQVSRNFLENYLEKHPISSLSDIERDVLNLTLKKKLRTFDDLRLAVSRIEQVKKKHPTASRLLDPIIKFYQEWDVFSQVNIELKKIVEPTSDTDEDDFEELSESSIPIIEEIGKKLYGKIWVAQLSRKLQNEQGKPLPQSTLKSIRDRNNFPLYIQKQLPAIYEERLAELKAIESLIYPDRKNQEA